jgi:hypothetical protein
MAQTLIAHRLKDVYNGEGEAPVPGISLGEVPEGYPAPGKTAG